MVSSIAGGSHYGLRDWLVQRTSAVIMVLYTIFLSSYVALNVPFHYGEWRLLFRQEWMRFFTLLFFLGLYLHAWVGIRNIFMDYVHSVAIRLMLHSVVIISLIIYLFWTVDILWGI